MISDVQFQVSRVTCMLSPAADPAAENKVEIEVKITVKFTDTSVTTCEAAVAALTPSQQQSIIDSLLRVFKSPFRSGTTGTSMTKLTCQSSSSDGKSRRLDGAMITSDSVSLLTEDQQALCSGRLSTTMIVACRPCRLHSHSRLDLK